MSEPTRRSSKAVFALEYVLLVACLVLFLVYAERQGAYTFAFTRAWWGI